MKQYLTQNNLLTLIAFLLAFFMISFPFVEHPYVVNEGPTWYGLDVSWQMTINYAKVMHWVWGKDIIYTYGPLGYLGTRLGFGISRWALLLFDLFMVANLFCIFRDFINNAVNKWMAVIIIFVCTLAVEPSHRSNMSWVMTLFAYYWMFRSYKEPKYIYFFFLIIDIVICFYMKLNVGLIGIVLLTGHLINLLIFKKINFLKAGIVLVILAASIGITALFFHVSLPAYIKGASEIVKGYNEIMFIEGEDYTHQELNISILFYSLLAFITIYIVALVRTRNLSQVFFSLIVFLYLFLLRKQGVIRNDFGHYFEFFSYIPLVLLFGNFLQPFEKKQNIVLGFILCFSIVSLFYTSERPKRSINEAVVRRYTGLPQYISLFNNYKKEPFLNNRHKRYIPARVLDQVKQSTIDVFPWDSEYLLENGLNYKPRPVFQSFSAYTQYLEEVNYQAYLKNPPEYILYDYESIDGRYPYNDDILVNFFICKNYNFADSFTSNGRWRVLLKKKPQIQPITLVRPKDGNFRIGEDIPVDWTMMMRIKVKYTLAGKLWSLFYRAPVLRVKMMRGNGQWQSYRVSGEILSAGIMVDRWINSNQDFVKYMVNKDSLDDFKKVRIVADTDDYKTELKVDYYNIK